MSQRYSKRDIVWAKIKGFPWWPGMVIKNATLLSIIIFHLKVADVILDENGEQSEVLINFIGENSQ